MIAIICWIIRQFWFNPFTPLGDIAVGLNLLLGGIFSAITYWLVGFVYDGDATSGSITYMILYAVNTAATYVFCLAYPSKVLMTIVCVGYIVIVIGTLKWIADR